MSDDRPTQPPFGWADRFFTFGITGTNGKTSTTHMLQSIVRATGAHCLMIGTLGYWLDERLLDELPRSLAGFHDAFRLAHAEGASWAAVECTSRALADGYAKRWRFDLAVFTNLSPDHLQTHGSWEHYLASKAQLFVHLGPGRTAVLNAGDVHALMIDQAIPADVQRRWFHAPSRGPLLRALDPARDLAADDVEIDADGTRMRLVPGELAERLGGALRVRMVGEVFAENALAAAVAAASAGVPDAAIVAGLAACPPVAGRFEVLHRAPVVAVDYAHSPDALERTCASARRLARGRVIVVFGAGGDSTPDKRGPMGEAVGAAVELAIVTNDNPRKEDPAAIARAVADGVARGGRARLVVELDRARAIELALDAAGPDDVVVIAGKGHERGQAQGGVVLPFSDVDEVRRILGGGAEPG